MTENALRPGLRNHAAHARNVNMMPRKPDALRMSRAYMPPTTLPYSDRLVLFIAPKKHALRRLDARGMDLDEPVVLKRRLKGGTI